MTQIKKNSFIVSCQALEDEPLHSSYIMGRMAKAAIEGGADGIRANSKEDIQEIKKHTELPVIGIVKRVYSHSDVFITATIKEVDELLESGASVIALDATFRKRPQESLNELVSYIRNKNKNIEIMADISTVEEAQHAETLGFDYIGTTLHGYTEYTHGKKLFLNDFQFLKDITQNISTPIIAEGNILTPDMLKRVAELDCHAYVVGGAITRPQLIAKSFSDVLK
jgi:N-acylglucosamine-6-phosphate 2-epimerase